jgi:hypothetical protein
VRVSRTLTLRKETLAELRTDELSLVAGGQAAVPTQPLGACLAAQTSKFVECDSNLRPCVSHTCTR